MDGVSKIMGEAQHGGSGELDKKWDEVWWEREDGKTKGGGGILVPVLASRLIHSVANVIPRP